MNYNTYMKILISADIEGVNGVVHPDQIYPDGKFYKEALEKWILELNAVIEGLNESGAKEIIINDSHNHMRNLDNSKLKGASVILGWQKPFSMVSTANEKYDACLFTGYHARATANGILSHTYRPRIIKKVILNGKEVGETGLNAALLGHYDTPIILVSGDDVTCSEAKDLLGKELITVETKKALSRYSAVSKPFDETLKALREGAKKAIKEKDKFKPYKLTSPTIQITFAEPNHADAAELIPNVKRIGNTEIELSHPDMPTLFKAFLAMGALAASRDDVLT